MAGDLNNEQEQSEGEASPKPSGDNPEELRAKARQRLVALIADKTLWNEWAPETLADAILKAFEPTEAQRRLAELIEGINLGMVKVESYWVYDEGDGPEGEDGPARWLWHDEWLHYARAAIGLPAKPAN